MNPIYRVQIDVCLRKPISEQSIWVRKLVNLPFVPRNGDSIKIESDDGEQTLTLELEAVTWDCSNGHFEVDITDDSMVDSFSESGVFSEAIVLSAYTPFGFTRLKAPVAQVIRA